METLKGLIELFNSLSPLGLAGLLGFIIYKLIEGNKSLTSMSADSTSRLESIASNHLHGLPEMTASLERIEKILQAMNDNIIYIRARVNGK